MLVVATPALVQVPVLGALRCGQVTRSPLLAPPVMAMASLGNVAIYGRFGCRKLKFKPAPKATLADPEPGNHLLDASRLKNATEGRTLSTRIGEGSIYSAWKIFLDSRSVVLRLGITNNEAISRG